MAMLMAGAMKSLSSMKPAQWKGMKDAMDSTSKAGSGGFQGIMDFIMNLKVMDVILKPIMALVKVFMASVMQPLYPILKMVGDAIMKFMPFVQKLGEMLGQVIAKILEKLIPILVQLMDEMGPPLFEILMLVADLIVELLPLLDIVFELVKIVMDLDKEFGLMKYLMIGIHIVAKALGIAIKFVSGWVKTVVGLFFGHSPGLIPGFEAIANIVKIVIDLIYKSFLKVIDTVILVIKEITTVIKIISDFIKNTLIAILKFLTDSLETLGAIIDTLVSGAITILQTILESLDNIISKLADSITALIGTITDGLIKILETLKAIVEAVATAVQNLVSAITTGLIAVFDSVKGVMDSFTDFLRELKELLIEIKNVGLPGSGGGGGGNGGDDEDWWDPGHLFAEGGIVTRPTRGIVGEHGTEAVIPLDKTGGFGGTTISISFGANTVIADSNSLDKLATEIQKRMWERLD